MSTNVLDTLESVNGIRPNTKGCPPALPSTKSRVCLMRNSIVVIAARALLASIENESIEKEDEELTDLQQLCFYHGKGGSGKSHLVRAFTALADSCWSRSSGVHFLLAPASQL